MNSKILKRMITMIFSVCMIISMLAGCGSKAVTQTDSKPEGDVTKVKERGLSFKISKEYIDKGVKLEGYNENESGKPIISIFYYYKPITDKLFEEMIDMKAEERTKPVEDAFYKKLYTHSKCIMNIVLLEEKEFKQEMEAGKTLDELSGFNNTIKFGNNDGYVYLLSIPKEDTKGMSEEEKKQYEECRNYMTTVKENLKFIPIELESNETKLPTKMPSFTTKDLKGNKITNSIFAEKDLTVVNVWGTFCGPCMDEMPELGEWAKDLPENVQIVGLVADIDEENDKEYQEKKELAEKIVTKANADFVQLIGNKDLKGFLSGIVGVPTTFFVDKEGNIVGEPIVGADVEGYKKFVEDYLK
ncbi:TlpA disulfide reductase family protein [Anaerosacchariphilus polymeriproducens]|nr:TlpA disulfide reductase family protein [Anaerosacchariphilus polymeriproducens]